MELSRHVPSARDVENGAREVARQASPFIEGLARFGYACRGAVYILVGVLAVRAALGAGGRVTDARGALWSMLGQPFGQILLAALAVGLAGYALYKFVSAALGTEAREGGAKGALKRLRDAGAGVLNAGLAVTAGELAVFARAAARGGGRSQVHWTAKLMALPFGRVLVIAVGLGVVVAGAVECWHAVRGRFLKQFDTHAMGPREMRLARITGHLGLAARAVVFAVVGTLFVRAGLTHDPGRATGIAGALRALRETPAGTGLMALVAAGLVLYGVFSFVLARYRRIVAS